MMVNDDGIDDWFDGLLNGFLFLHRVGIDAPTIGDLFHITKPNLCWRLYPQYLGDVQLGHLPTLGKHRNSYGHFCQT